MSLRLGVNCAVFNDEGQLLLSQRSDLNVWNLPGGRVDAGESLGAACIREVREETGIAMQIERAVGLYYLAGWRRLNVLFTGRMVEVESDLQQRTTETRANRFFAPDALPDMPWDYMTLDTLAGTRHKPRVIETARRDRRRLKRRFALRYLWNLLRGRPEPQFPQFDIRAVAVIWDEHHRRVLTLPERREQILPRVICDGERAPWDDLAQMIAYQFEVYPAFRWVGVWQSPAHEAFELIFAATVPQTTIPDQADWTLARNAALSDLDMEYVSLVKPGYASAPVWSLNHTYDATNKHELPAVILMGTNHDNPD